MTRAVCKLGDKCSGHSCFPPRANNTASENVFANGIGIHRLSDSWNIHCCDDSCHDGVTSTGSSTVFVNGLACGRIGDSISCGSVIAEGSHNVFSG